MSELVNNIHRVHTTAMGLNRLMNNLSVDTDPVDWCKSAILSVNAVVERKGKNYYITTNGVVITVNASSYTIITAHKIKE